MRREKRRLRKQWDREWGDIDTEANLWWLGNARENWVSVMGHNVWEWFCMSCAHACLFSCR